MKFQNQQKGLFTFYREQQFYEEQVQQYKNLKSNPQLESHSQKDSPTMQKPTAPRQKLINSVSLTSQPVLLRQSSNQQRQKVRCKKYGDGVMVINRKSTDQSTKKSRQDSRYRQMGSYLENKCIELDHCKGSKDHSGSISKSKRVDNNKREEYLRVRKETRESTQLPSLGKIEQPEPFRSPTEARHKINGSLIRSGGNDILRHARGRAEMQARLQKKSVSYFEFSRDYMNEKQKKTAALSIEQQKLLEILNRYRKYDR